MDKIVFIDRGNFFRSPIAKGIYNKLTNSNCAESYGTCVTFQGRENKNLGIYPELKQVIQMTKNIGIDLSNEQCKQIYPEALIGIQKIILMAESDVPDWLSTYKFEHWEIPNPTELDTQIIEQTINLLEMKIIALLKEKNFT